MSSSEPSTTVEGIKALDWETSLRPSLVADKEVLSQELKGDRMLFSG